MRDPAAMTVPASGPGEFAFGAVIRAADIAFTFAGSDEGDEAVPAVAP